LTGFAGVGRCDRRNSASEVVRRAIILLACVLALNAADAGVIGAVADQLRASLHIGNTQVGVLTAVPAAVGAAATIPVGQVTDRMPRVPLLAGSIVLWSLAMVGGGLASSYVWLLLSRVALGAVTATAGPTVASLAGDLFPPAERARIYGRILAGELVGAGFGLLAGGDAAALIGWRASFWLVAACGFGLAVALWRLLPEPQRGGIAQQAWSTMGSARGTDRSGPQADVARRLVDDRDVDPDPRRVLRSDPASLPFLRAVRYVLGIPTNLMLVIASAVGYFFFAGLRTFAVVFVLDRYGVTKIELTAVIPVIGLGALAGVLLGGRLADALVRRGHAAARVVVPGAAYAFSALIFLPGLLTDRLLVAVPLFTLAAATLAAANPPLDAARLDIVHSRLRGRAESVRTLTRMGAEAAAPVVFGRLSELLTPGATASRGAGLDHAFLITLAALLANGLVLLRARRTYPRDVATAVASERASPPGR
jgi:predicted MFS family arabinose efflux permease